MKRWIVSIALVMSLVVAATPAAAAAPVSRAIAHREIRHWWLGHNKLFILWCAPKRYGTVCGLRDYFRYRNHFGATQGYEDKIVWVSRTNGHVRIVFLWENLTASAS